MSDGAVAQAAQNTAAQTKHFLQALEKLKDSSDSVMRM
jgi:hypothetical protein